MRVEKIGCRSILSILLVVLFLIGCLAPSHESWAQDEYLPLGDVLTAYPLRPPQLESPRATLRSFIEYANEAVELWRDEAPRDSIRRAGRRATLCLDLSAFPLATREAIGIEKVLLLKEILDRVEIPPFEEIPNSTVVRGNRPDDLDHTQYRAHDGPG